MAFSRDGVIFSCEQLDKYNLQYNILTITQYGITEETMETRLVVILMFNDSGNGCRSSMVTIAIGNKELDVIIDCEALSPWQLIAGNNDTYGQ